MKKQKSPLFVCFSPPVMLATFVIEILLLIFTIYRFKKAKITKLVILILFCLAFFQLSEFFVCGGVGLDAKFWSRMGFIAITLLPPLGVHLIQAIANKQNSRIISVAYIAAFAWVVIFGFSELAFAGHMCAGNYAIFQFKPAASFAYSIFYYGWLLYGIYLASVFRRKVTSKKKSNALLGMIIGYFVFMIPTGVANVVDPTTINGIPSIMCGFAILYALILVGYILPLAAKTKVSRR